MARLFDGTTPIGSNSNFYFFATRLADVYLYSLLIAYLDWRLLSTARRVINTPLVTSN
jgi:hypothetical protein